MGEDIKSATKKLAYDLLNKWDRTYLETCGYVRAFLYLNLVQTFSLLSRGPHSGKPRQARNVPVDGVEASRLEIR